MNLFSHIKQRVPILNIVQEYTTLKRAGLYWKGCCPFHHERTASFTVSPHKEIFYCFGCHKGGDVIRFIEEMENCSPGEAARHLADRYNLTIPQDLAHEQTSITHVHEKKNDFDLCTIVAAWCHEKLLKNSAARSYVEKRGIS